MASNITELGYNTIWHDMHEYSLKEWTIKHDVSGYVYFAFFLLEPWNWRWETLLRKRKMARKKANEFLETSSNMNQSVFQSWKLHYLYLSSISKSATEIQNTHISITWSRQYLFPEGTFRKQKIHLLLAASIPYPVWCVK